MIFKHHYFLISYSKIWTSERPGENMFHNMRRQVDFPLPKTWADLPLSPLEAPARQFNPSGSSPESYKHLLHSQWVLYNVWASSVVFRSVEISCGVFGGDFLQSETHQNHCHSLAECVILAEYLEFGKMPTGRLHESPESHTDRSRPSPQSTAFLSGSNSSGGECCCSRCARWMILNSWLRQQQFRLSAGLKNCVFNAVCVPSRAPRKH